MEAASFLKALSRSFFLSIDAMHMHLVSVKNGTEHRNFVVLLLPSEAMLALELLM